jgi:hypothetical protein
VRIVLGNASLATYLQGGGHWSWFLQYPLGLRALRHDVFWLELLVSSGEREHDVRLIRDFFQRLASYGLDAGTRARGHEFHGSRLGAVPASVPRVYAVSDGHGGSPRAEGFAVGSTLMSYVHLHFGSNPALAANFTGACRR